MRGTATAIETAKTEDIDESEWLSAASANEAFGFLREPEEDVYTTEDGKPFRSYVYGESENLSGKML